MVKMIMSLPSHIDGEKYMELTMSVIKGRYGKDGYYSGMMPYASLIINPVTVSKIYVKGYSGKNGLHYYEIDAEELDPVIIATLEELGAMVGMGYCFVSEDGKMIEKEWWKPQNPNFQHAPYYYESESLDEARGTYENALMLLNGKAYWYNGALYKMA